MNNIDTNALITTIAELQTLLTWKDGWNTYNAKAPNPLSVSIAEQWITEFYQHITSSNQQWIVPHVGSGGDGDVEFDWRYGQRKLSIYFDEDGIEYLQVHGKGINAPMTDGDIKNIDDALKLWQWLLETPQENEEL